MANILFYNDSCLDNLIHAMKFPGRIEKYGLDTKVTLTDSSSLKVKLPMAEASTSAGASKTKQAKSEYQMNAVNFLSWIVDTDYAYGLPSYDTNLDSEKLENIIYYKAAYFTWNRGGREKLLTDKGWCVPLPNKNCCDFSNWVVLDLTIPALLQEGHFQFEEACFGRLGAMIAYYPNGFSKPESRVTRSCKPIVIWTF